MATFKLCDMAAPLDLPDAVKKAKVASLFPPNAVIDTNGIELNPAAQWGARAELGLRGEGRHDPRETFMRGALSTSHVNTLGRHGGRDRLYAAFGQNETTNVANASNGMGFAAFDYYRTDIAFRNFVTQTPPPAPGSCAFPGPDVCCKLLVVCIKPIAAIVPLTAITADSDHTIETAYPSPNSRSLSNGFGPNMAIVRSTKHPETWTVVALVTFRMNCHPAPVRYLPSIRLVEAFKDMMHSNLADTLGIIDMIDSNYMGELTLAGGLLALARWVHLIIQHPGTYTNPRLLDDTCVTLSRMIESSSQARITGAADNGLFSQLVREIPKNVMAASPLLSLVKRIPRRLAATLEQMAHYVLRASPTSAANCAVVYSHCYTLLLPDWNGSLARRVRRRLEDLAREYTPAPNDPNNMSIVKCQAFVVPACAVFVQHNNPASLMEHIKAAVATTERPWQISGILRAIRKCTSPHMSFPDNTVLVACDAAIEARGGAMDTEFADLYTIIARLSLPASASAATPVVDTPISRKRNHADRATNAPTPTKRHKPGEHTTQ